jgi:hypothetical protein
MPVEYKQSPYPALAARAPLLKVLEPLNAKSIVGVARGEGAY